MSKRIIRVTEDDIKLGERQSYCACPVARAVRRAFRGRDDVIVRHEGIFVGNLTDDGKFWAATVPDNLSSFLSRFDRGWRVQPSEFEVDFR